ncbi:unnamed protein product [Protopolystoma xenopodis]|uniref:Cyclic nucleotide-binding domain-containing protein n=1 Tax=Protopolystoma xenopodis TaxID=117903 RepID=A0A448X846_9PLAT|nr:unnamed protein product [Protopolystoma xenopodis]
MTGLMDNKPKEAQPVDNHAIESFVKNNSRENISKSKQAYDKVVFPKSDSQRSCLLNCIKPILIFKALKPKDLDEVVDVMFERLVVPNEEIILIGDVGDNFLSLILELTISSFLHRKD